MRRRRQFYFVVKRKGGTIRTNNPSIITQTCILCLEEMTTKQRLSYSTNVCACKPHIHDTCFNEWDRRNPGSCPICRKEGTVFVEPRFEARGVPVVSASAATTDDMGGFCCMVGCWSGMDLLNAFTS